MTGTSVYNIVSNYLEHCKGKVVPYGGSIDAKKEEHEDYDKPWNPPGRVFVMTSLMHISQLSCWYRCKDIGQSGCKGVRKED